VQALEHDYMVVAPALIPKRAGERIKMNRRDAVTLAGLYRASELTGVWAPDPAHEAVRDLARPGRRRLMIFGESVSSFFLSSSGIAGFTVGPDLPDSSCAA
jgi:transposase